MRGIVEIGRIARVYLDVVPFAIGRDRSDDTLREGGNGIGNTGAMETNVAAVAKLDSTARLIFEHKLSASRIDFDIRHATKLKVRSLGWRNNAIGSRRD